MSTPEQEREQKSSVKISTTAKGDPLVEVKVYDGTDRDALELVRSLAVEAYTSTREELKS